MEYLLICLGDFPIYNLMGCTGFILGLLLFMNNLEKLNLTQEKNDQILLIFALSFLAAMLCANIGNWFVMPELWGKSILEKFSQAGLAFYFGLIGFVVFATILLKICRYRVATYINLIVPSLLLFHALGRIGCILAGCCYGKLVNLNIFNIIEMVRFPVREIEALMLFMLFLLTQFKIKENKLLFYLFTYPPLRFILEFWRGDYRGIKFCFDLSIAQVISITLLASALIYLVIIKIRHNREINYK